jgi:DNA helicase II / ATP-dependent DNA helicase PcrA
MHPIKSSAAFTEAYNFLNPQQKQAVDTIYGPVMVMAGPGTGKTQILAVRIANLLCSDAQINASEILCITYTDAGRLAMRNRLNEIIGTDITQQIAIHTFHSFCNEVIQSNLQYFDRYNIQQASELEQYTTIKTVLDKLPYGHIFKNPKNPYDSAPQLLNLFENMKKENWSSAFLSAKIDEYITEIMPLDADLHYVAKAKAGERRPQYALEEERLLKTKAAAQLFDAYIQELKKADRYDYHDMIQWVVKALDTHDDLRFRYAEQYQYLLVDEYQDTNGAQNDVIKLLCSENDVPNLFVVGDDDQSIYRFQGASMENMQSVEKNYPSLVKIKLTQNYRSYAEILNTAEQFINHNTERLKKDNQPLIATNGNSNTPPLLIGLQNKRQEFIYIAKEIEKLVAQHIEPKQIAVLLPTNKNCLELSEYLQHLQIPYHTKSKLNLLQLPLVQHIIQIIRYINAECDTPFSGDLLLFQLLHFNYFGIDALAIAKANLQSNRAAKAQETISRSFREYLYNYTQIVNPAQFAEKVDAKILDAFKVLEGLIKETNNTNLFPFFKAVVKQSGIYPYILKQPNKIELINELTALFDFIEKETKLQPEMTVKQFVELLDVMKANNIQEDFYKPMGKDNGVQLLTIHSSKGREFEHVFVGCCTSKKLESKRGSTKDFKIPMNVFDDNYIHKLDDKDQIKSAKKELNNEELRRLLYVAATRAKHNLTFSFYRLDEQEKEEGPSQFLMELFPAKDAVENAVNDEAVSIEMMAQFEPIWIINNHAPNIKLLEKEYIQEQLKNFTLSVSALNNFVKCPLHFYFNNILKVPSGLSENASFGSAVHTAMEYIYTTIHKETKEFAPVEKLIEVFKKDMFIRRETFTTEGYHAKVEYGINILRDFYTEKILGSNTIVSVEYNATAEWKGIPLKGFLDKIEFNGNDANIVDYKTGKYDGAYAKDCRKEPFSKGVVTNKGGNYWRQGAFYNLLLTLDKKNTWNPVSSEFVFVEPVKPNNEYKTKMFHTTPQDIDLVKEQIEDAWQKIQAHHFYTGCGEEKCDWCNFTKQHGLENLLHEVADHESDTEI